MGQKNQKSLGQKKLVKSNKSISRKNFWIKFHFLQFQKWPNINFWTGKKFNTAKNAISRKKIVDLFDFTSSFAWTFLNFLAYSVIIIISCLLTFKLDLFTYRYSFHTSGWIVGWYIWKKENYSIMSTIRIN